MDQPTSPPRADDGAPPRRRLRRLARWWASTRPVSPESARVLLERWRALPPGARTPAQLLGRHAVGCEGTHGVFPRCNLTCTPCYHSADANKVRVDSDHTLAQVEAQMAHLRRTRGPRAHAQLIGGEVTLLDPDTHAEALAIMRRYGREPMSFSHGDVDEAYLRRLVLAQDGTLRLPRVSFAVHVDSLMRGRRGAPRPRSEAELMPFRREVVAMFERLRRDHGLRYYLAHNMTVTPSNLAEVADVVRHAPGLGFSMMSFQPAAYLGDARRWREDLRAATPDAVWAEVERGIGTRLPWQALQIGDTRCNRTAFGWLVGARWVPLLDDTDTADLRARDTVLAHAGGVQVGDTPAHVLLPRLLRLLAGHPVLVPVLLRWAHRALRRSGGLAAVVRDRPRPLTFVMHTFMDAADVAPAWSLLQQGLLSDDPSVRATQERLQGCAYSMAHPDRDELVPACVQHSVLDPGENAALRRLLPLVDVTSGRGRG